MLSWHVALTDPFKGMLAEGAICAMGYQVFNPKVKTEHVYRKVQRDSIRQLVPGYIFARFDVERDGWQRIAKARGVKDFMYAGHEVPARVRDDKLLPLMSMCEDGYVMVEEVDRFLFKVGSTAKVMEGPFAGWAGRVVRSSHERVTVMLEIFGRRTPVAGKAAEFEPT